MKKAFLFDLDGTLVDTAPDLCGTIADMQQARGLPPTPLSEIQHLSSGGAKALLGAGFQISPDQAEFDTHRAEFLKRYEQRIAQSSTVYQGIEELLQLIEQQGHVWGVVTNKPYYLAKQLLNELNLLNRSAVLVGGDSAEKPKPSPHPCLMASKTVKVPPGQCIMIGDDVRDIESGKAAGMTTAAVRYGYLASDIETWQADHIFDTPHHMHNWLNSLAG